MKNCGGCNKFKICALSVKRLRPVRRPLNSALDGDVNKYTTFESRPVLSEREFRAKVVIDILNGRPEQAVKRLSKYYGVIEPSLRVGTVKRHRKVLACYVEKEKRIYISKSALFTDPFVILHEFYHHLRASPVSRNRQVEKRADLFALKFIQDFRHFGATSTGRSAR
jgi:hypothetical protein